MENLDQVVSDLRAGCDYRLKDGKMIQETVLVTRKGFVAALALLEEKGVKEGFLAALALLEETQEKDSCANCEHV